MSIVVLDPTPSPPPAALGMAPALPALAGRRIGLLDNGKIRVRELLDHVETILREQYGVADVVRQRKKNQNAPAPAAIIAALATCDAAVSAVGD
jgi:hypothetical protein